MRILVTILMILGSSQAITQEYFNRIIPFEFGNPNPIEIVQFNDNYVIPIIYYYEPFDQSTIILVNDVGHVEYYHYQDFVFATKSLNIIDNSLFSFAKDRNYNKALKLGNLGSDFDFIWVTEILTIGSYNFPGPSLALEKSIYNSFFYTENEIKKIGINKTNFDGDIAWTKYFESNIGYSYPWDLHSTKDQNLLSSYSLRYDNEFQSSAYVMKFDSLGNVIWKTSPMGDLDGGAAPIWVTELSDSSIFLTYRKNKKSDPEFNDYYPYPPTMIWLDKDGSFIKEQINMTPYHDLLTFSGIKAGKGNYFFTFGQFEDYDGPQDDNHFGIITKYTNAGDTIWTHKYRHPDFNAENIAYTVVDMIELDNGDIVALGKITPAGEMNRIWLFRINGQGCFGDSACNEVVLTDNTEPIQSDPKVLIYPNPADEVLHIDAPSDKISKIEIFNLQGDLLQSIICKESHLKVNIRDLMPGTYFALITLNGIEIETYKFIVL